MKRIFITSFIALCIGMVMPAQAQVNFGVKGGLNLSKASFSNVQGNFKKDNFTGFFIGPMAEITVPVVGLGVDGALLFSQRGIEIEGEKIKQNGLDIPINLKYTVGLGDLFGLYLAAGPNFFFDFAKNKHVLDLFDTDKRRTEVGINLGAGLKLINHLQLGFNYNIPLGDSAKILVDGAENASYKTKTWQVSLAYIF